MFPLLVLLSPPFQLQDAEKNGVVCQGGEHVLPWVGEAGGGKGGGRANTVVSIIICGWRELLGLPHHEACPLLRKALISHSHL